jgi:hypothetical protein
MIPSKWGTADRIQSAKAKEFGNINIHVFRLMETPSQY